MLDELRQVEAQLVDLAARAGRVLDRASMETRGEPDDEAFAEYDVSHGADRAWATETQLTAFARMAVAEFVRVTAGVGSVTLATEDGDTMTTEDGQPIEAEGVSLAGNELTVVDAQPAEATAEAEDATTDEASVYRRMGANRDLRPRGN